ncbi:MAG: diadenylate cyclase CdaA [Planctomycetes bacterium]|nr:diadenylate cyclase CdaA [Planctomycetota bacterium]
MFEWISNLYQGPWWLVKTMTEIGIISVFVYVAMSFMRGTRGAGVLRGLILVYMAIFTLLLFVARVFDLQNVVAIMEHLVAVSLVAVMVIFQPEIRRGLVRLGEGALRIFSGSIGTIEEDIADASVAIARKGEVGALLVMEREIKIGSYIESGVVLDSAISSQLLRTIFTKNTPLHDGAVIIRQGRIAAANCLLPLSENVEECRGMGTRHRAAIGLTEETDAVVIVVSEETGTISVAMEGKITRGFDYESLQAFLRKNCFQVEDGSLQTDTGEVRNA